MFSLAEITAAQCFWNNGNISMSAGMWSGVLLANAAKRFINAWCTRPIMWRVVVVVDVVGGVVVVVLVWESGRLWKKWCECVCVCGCVKGEREEHETKSRHQHSNNMFCWWGRGIEGLNDRKPCECFPSWNEKKTTKEQANQYPNNKSVSKEKKKKKKKRGRNNDNLVEVDIGLQLPARRQERF
jgi:hypothetical protein